MKNSKRKENFVKNHKKMENKPRRGWCLNTFFIFSFVYSYTLAYVLINESLSSFIFVLRWRLVAGCLKWVRYLKTRSLYLSFCLEILAVYLTFEVSNGKPLLRNIHNMELFVTSKGASHHPRVLAWTRFLNICFASYRQNIFKRKKKISERMFEEIKWSIGGFHSGIIAFYFYLRSRPSA